LPMRRSGPVSRPRICHLAPTRRNNAWPSSRSTFPARAKPGEVVVFSWITYKSKADQKRIMKKVMEDPRLSKMMDPANMPFDMSRMAWVGFKPIVEA